MSDSKTGTPRSIPRIVGLSICFCAVLFSSVLLGQPRGCLAVMRRSQVEDASPAAGRCICGKPATHYASYTGGKILWLCDSCAAPETIGPGIGQTICDKNAPINWIMLAIPIVVHVVGLIFFGFMLNEAIYSPVTAGQPMGHGAEGITLLVVLTVAGNLFCFFFVGG